MGLVEAHPVVGPGLSGLLLAYHGSGEKKRPRTVAGEGGLGPTHVPSRT